MEEVPMMAFERRQKKKSGLGGLLSSALGFIPGQLLGKAADSTKIGQKLTNPYGNPGILGKAIGAAGGIQDTALRQGLPAGAMMAGGKVLKSAFGGVPGVAPGEANPYGIEAEGPPAPRTPGQGSLFGGMKQFQGDPTLFVMFRRSKR